MFWKKDILINSCSENCQGKFSVKTIEKYLWRSSFLVRLYNLVRNAYLKMNFLIGIFQVFWLQISEHIFSRTPLKWILLQRCIQDLVKHLRWSFTVNIINSLKPLTIFTKKLHLRCFARFCVHLCSEVKSSIYQTYKFKVYSNSFWRHCNVFDVDFARINETLCPLSDVILSKNLELLFDCICYKYKNNHLYHVSKEDVKWLFYLGVEYYSSRESNFWEKN